MSKDMIKDILMDKMINNKDVSVLSDTDFLSDLEHFENETCDNYGDKYIDSYNRGYSDGYNQGYSEGYGDRERNDGFDPRY